MAKTMKSLSDMAVFSHRTESDDQFQGTTEQPIKPFKGYFKDWIIKTTSRGDQYILGQFWEHPSFHGKYGHSSLIVNKHEGDGCLEIETLNSKYKLNYNEERPDKEFWDMS